MAKFQFQMEAVLQYRRLMAGREQVLLDGLIRERDYWAWQDRQLDEVRETARRSAPDMARNGLYSMGGQDAFTERARRQQKQVAVRQAECLQRVAAQQAKVSDARRSVKLLEKLREKAFEDWRKDQDRKMEELTADSYQALRSREQREGRGG